MASPHYDCYGCLERPGRLFNKKRWYGLQGTRLMCFKNASDAVPKEQYEIRGVEIHDGPGNQFSIALPPSQKPMLLKSELGTEKAMWLAALQVASRGGTVCERCHRDPPRGGGRLCAACLAHAAKQRVCPLFVHGLCRRGNACPNLHTGAPAPAVHWEAAVTADPVPQAIWLWEAEQALSGFVPFDPTTSTRIEAAYQLGFPTHAIRGRNIDFAAMVQIGKHGGHRRVKRVPVVSCTDTERLATGGEFVCREFLFGACPNGAVCRLLHPTAPAVTPRPHATGRSPPGQAKKEAAPGVAAHDIARLPQFPFVKAGENTEPSCQICFEDYAVGDVQCALPCLHCFHFECVEKWLLKHKDCPACQTPVDLRALEEYVD